MTTTTVTIIRTTNRFRRSMNGAWLGAGSDVSKCEVDEAQALGFVLGGGLSASTEIVWPDGHREFFGHNSSMYLYGPAQSRLRRGDGDKVYGSTWYLS